MRRHVPLMFIGLAVLGASFLAVWQHHLTTGFIGWLLGLALFFTGLWRFTKDTKGQGND